MSSEVERALVYGFGKTVLIELRDVRRFLKGMFV